jgi:hypothetical protein
MRASRAFPQRFYPLHVITASHWYPPDVTTARKGPIKPLIVRLSTYTKNSSYTTLVPITEGGTEFEEVQKAQCFASGVEEKCPFGSKNLAEARIQNPRKG